MSGGFLFVRVRVRVRVNGEFIVRTKSYNKLANWPITTPSSSIQL